MARKLNITVNNNTSLTLTLNPPCEPKHGKFTTSPPSIIKATGNWACETREGGLYGPEGRVIYKTNKNGRDVEIEFYYNHPIGSATSSYKVTITPSDVIGYEIKGSFTGHNQDITFELYEIK